MIKIVDDFFLIFIQKLRHIKAKPIKFGFDKKWSYNRLNESQALISDENSTCFQKMMLRFAKIKCEKVTLMNISDII